MLSLDGCGPRRFQTKYTDSIYEFWMQQNGPIYVPDEQSHGWSLSTLRRLAEEREARKEDDTNPKEWSGA